MLLTRPPLVSIPKDLLPFDLHVLSMPPAFNLSQDQTLRFKANLGASPKTSGLGLKRYLPQRSKLPHKLPNWFLMSDSYVSAEEVNYDPLV